MALFIIGFIVGAIVAEIVTLLALGMCRALAEGEQQGELERLELEQKNKIQITGN